jgi:hypothetical protein
VLGRASWIGVLLANGGEVSEARWVRRVQRVEERRIGVWRGVRATSGGYGRYEKAVVV